MESIRTPDEHFENLEGYEFEPNYVEIEGLRLHYLDEGPADGPPVVLMHGEPSWCYLYRKMIPILAQNGFRCIAPDLIGFGRSDKLVNMSDYSYQFHVNIIDQFLKSSDLQNATFFGHDWGGLIGLRVLTQNTDRFTRIIVANTGLPTGDHRVSEAFLKWREYSQTTENFRPGEIIKRSCIQPASDELIKAYDAPFPDDSYKAGARIFPVLVPISPNDPASEANRKAWKILQSWEKPCLTAFSDEDPVTRGGERPFQKLIPGAANQAHVTIKDAGHFLQEDKGEELAGVIMEFIKKTS